MKRGINLSLGKKSVDKAFRKLFIVTGSIFFLTVIVSLALITYRLVLKSSFDALEQKEQQLNSELLAQQEKKDKLIETKSRILDVKKIIASRAPTTVRIDTLSEFVPADAIVDALSGTDTDIEITLESESLTSLNGFIEQRIAEVAKDKKKGIKKIEMHNFGLNPKTLKYIISLGVKFS
jgi:Tfp pilus assembly protein PilN